MIRSSRSGSLLLEQIVTIGVLAIILVVTAVSMVQINKAQKQSQLTFEANTICKRILETELAKSVELHPLGPRSTVNSKFGQGNAYQLDVEIFGPPPEVSTTIPDTRPAPPAPQLPYVTGRALGANDIKGIRVSVKWNDAIGNHAVISEGFCINMTR
jgi:hypothetical protein